ncbi:hypothetical protein [Paenibacillus terrigena]|uniref:hypothetical protein n=1 Tax=Paenibacillus terrigena TaxID=369333 RepID=UPI00036D985E|nr:hypothetical protein [Paenibacillus terrigena]
MKRYLLSIVLGVCTLGILCTYYTYGAADHLPEYKLTTVQGDPKEGADLELSGNYDGRMHTESLVVNGNGSKYRSRETLRDQILGARSWVYNNKEMEQWVRDHRQFMRGKDQTEGFYKDDEWLVYVKVKSPLGRVNQKEVELSVERLNLKTDEVQQYTTQIPVKSDSSNFTNVVDVQRIKDQLHVLASQDTDKSIQYFDYMLNFESGAFIQGEQITHWNNTNKDIEFDYDILYNAGDPSGYAVFKVQENKVKSRGENSYSFEPSGVHLYVYSYQSGKLSALPDPKQILIHGTVYGHTGEVLNYVNVDKNAVHLSRYNLSTGQEERDYATIKATELDAAEILTANLFEDRVYVLMKKGVTPLIAALDVSNGKVLYVGETALEGSALDREKEMKLLNLYNINITKTTS